MAGNRRLARSVYTGGKLYGPKDLKTLAAVLSPEQVEYLKEQRVLLGNWSPDEVELPADFPKRKVLVKAGFETISSVRGASDGTLHEIGITPINIVKIRAYLGQ